MPKWIRTDEQMPDDYRLVPTARNATADVYMAYWHPTWTPNGGEWLDGHYCPLGNDPEYWYDLPTITI